MMRWRKSIQRPFPTDSCTSHLERRPAITAKEYGTIKEAVVPLTGISLWTRWMRVRAGAAQHQRQKLLSGCAAAAAAAAEGSSGSRRQQQKAAAAAAAAAEGSSGARVLHARGAYGR